MTSNTCLPKNIEMLNFFKFLVGWILVEEFPWEGDKCEKNRTLGTEENTPQTLSPVDSLTT